MEPQWPEFSNSQNKNKLNSELFCLSKNFFVIFRAFPPSICLFRISESVFGIHPVLDQLICAAYGQLLLADWELSTYRSLLLLALFGYALWVQYSIVQYYRFYLLENIFFVLLLFTLFFLCNLTISTDIHGYTTEYLLT